MRLFVLAVLAALLLPALAAAHPERNTFFPDHTRGERPTVSTAPPTHVVCKPDSRQRIIRSWAGRGSIRTRTRRTLLRRLRRCRFQHIQEAVNAARSGSRIQVMPGVYREEPSRRVTFNDPRCANDNPEYWEPTNDGHGENGRVPTYRFHWDCPNSRNLIQVLGDSPDDPDRECDQRCDLQISGAGRRARDVLIEGDRIKRDVIRADRADGFVLTNLTVEEASFNGVDVVETNGFRLTHLVARYNQNYGVLTFTSDNGLYDTIEAYRNGDSGVYPGSGPEGHCQRYGIEIRNVDSYENVLGLSGTAGNGTWTHNSRFRDNSAGVINDSFASGHPGMPQDCSRWTDNEVHSNNFNPFENSNEQVCNSTPFERRRQEQVCPQFQVPVGTGFGFFGANANIIRDNRVWNNWRSGYTLFWVPGSIRGDNSPEAQRDTSNGNRITGNTFGVRPDGTRDPNGVDVYWDEQGIGNCWQGNTGPGGAAPRSDPATLPDCTGGGSTSPVSNPRKTAQEASCAAWDPQDNPDPPGCTWFTTPPEPR
jgi:hypothetical protein